MKKNKETKIDKIRKELDIVSDKRIKLLEDWKDAIIEDLKENHVGKFYIEHLEWSDPYYIEVKDVFSSKEETQFDCIIYQLGEERASGSRNWIPSYRVNDWIAIPQKHFEKIRDEVFKRLKTK